MSSAAHAMYIVSATTRPPMVAIPITSTMVKTMRVIIGLLRRGGAAGRLACRARIKPHEYA